VKGRKLVNIVDPHIKRDSGSRLIHPSMHVMCF